MHWIIPGSILFPPPTGPSPPPLRLTCFPILPASDTLMASSSQCPLELLEDFLEASLLPNSKSQEQKQEYRTKKVGGDSPGPQASLDSHPSTDIRQFCDVGQVPSPPAAAALCLRGIGKLTPTVLSSSHITEFRVWKSSLLFLCTFSTYWGSTVDVITPY